jgi:hypothetical protein
VKRTKSVHRPDLSESLPAEASLLRYIESSALVAAILERDVEAFAQVREIGRRVTSALPLAEAARAVGPRPARRDLVESAPRFAPCRPSSAAVPSSPSPRRC